MPTVKYGGTESSISQLNNFYNKAADLIYESAVSHAAAALYYFRTHQRNMAGRGDFWTNRTRKAATAWFTRAYRTPTAIGFYAAHGDRIYYGKYLEYGYDERFASLKPVMDLFIPHFLEEAKKILNMERL